MFGIIRDDFTKMSIYNLQDLIIAYSVSTKVKEILAFTFPHLRMFTLYSGVSLDFKGKKEGTEGWFIII